MNNGSRGLGWLLCADWRSPQVGAKKIGGAEKGRGWKRFGISSPVKQGRGEKSEGGLHRSRGLKPLV
jgi:hypothetical protein